MAHYPYLKKKSSSVYSEKWSWWTALKEKLTETKVQPAKFDQTEKKQGEDGKQEMEVEGFEHLHMVFISPIEKLMDEFKGSVTHFINKYAWQSKTNLKQQKVNAVDMD